MHVWIVLSLFLSIAFGSNLLWTGNTLRNDLIPEENHYLVYEVEQDYVITGHLELTDQFGTSLHTFVVLDHFANPVDKNQEGLVDSLVHQTWWRIPDSAQPTRLVDLENQFGAQRWWIGDGSYLLLPSSKNASPPAPLPPDASNHYKCYDAQGPSVDLQVTLVDQFGTITALVAEPKFFCNAVTKSFNGEVTEPVDPLTHLACYQLDPEVRLTTTLQVTDQFGTWDLRTVRSQWLCVPTSQAQAVPTESETWGRVKMRYE